MKDTAHRGSYLTKRCVLCITVSLATVTFTALLFQTKVMDGWLTSDEFPIGSNSKESSATNNDRTTNEQLDITHADRTTNEQLDITNADRTTNEQLDITHADRTKSRRTKRLAVPLDQCAPAKEICPRKAVLTCKLCRIIEKCNGRDHITTKLRCRPGERQKGKGKKIREGLSRSIDKLESWF